MISLYQKQQQQQRLTPQQVLQQKLLQLNVAALEQRIKEEIEINPLLEESPLEEVEFNETDNDVIIIEQENPENDYLNLDKQTDSNIVSQDEKLEEYWENYVKPSDDYEGFKADTFSIDNDGNEFIQPNEQTLLELLYNQLSSYNLSEPETAIAEEILGNIDSDGYLRRDLLEIVDDTNAYVTQIRNGWLIEEEDYHTEINDNLFESYKARSTQEPFGRERLVKSNEDFGIISLVTANKLLHIIQRIDPPASGSRNLQGSLLIQLELNTTKYFVNLIAEKIIKDFYEEFSLKHFDQLKSKLHCSQDELKDAIELIKKLNPKPGIGSQSMDSNNIIMPDFFVESEANKLIITTNDKQVPQLRISKDYKDLVGRKGAKENSLDKKAQTFIRENYDSANIFIQLLRERKKSLIAVMQTIADYQFDFFSKGPEFLIPMVYRHIVEKTGADKSTISRVVNGKYVQTSHGIYELRSLFTEGSETDSGEEVSTNLIRNEITKMIEKEDKKKPLSDDDISTKLKEIGFNSARRTVSKYREQLKIPVARLRKEM